MKLVRDQFRMNVEDDDYIVKIERWKVNGSNKREPNLDIKRSLGINLHWEKVLTLQVQVYEMCHQHLEQQGHAIATKHTVQSHGLFGLSLFIYFFLSFNLYFESNYGMRFDLVLGFIDTYLYSGLKKKWGFWKINRQFFFTEKKSVSLNVEKVLD